MSKLPPVAIRNSAGSGLRGNARRRLEVHAPGCALILGYPAGDAPPRGPNLQAVAAWMNARDFVSIELGIARKVPPLPMIAM
jgi:hypothetical protein